MFMSDVAAMSDCHQRLLGELAELGMGLARDLQARALAATEVREATEIALAFHRISRSLRQTFALQAKLARERHTPQAQAVELAERHARLRRRHAEVRRAVEALIWTEYEGDEADGLEGELDELLADAVQDETLVDGTVEDHVAGLCELLGLSPPAAAPGARAHAPDTAPAGAGAGDPPPPLHSSA
jgi:uncharacterized membrane protein YccC